MSKRTRVTLSGDTIVQAIHEFIVRHALAPQGHYKPVLYQWHYKTNHEVSADGAVRATFKLDGLAIELELTGPPPQETPSPSRGNGGGETLN